MFDSKELAALQLGDRFTVSVRRYIEILDREVSFAFTSKLTAHDRRLRDEDTLFFSTLDEDLTHFTVISGDPSPEAACIVKQSEIVSIAPEDSRATRQRDVFVALQNGDWSLQITPADLARCPRCNEVMRPFEDVVVMHLTHKHDAPISTRTSEGSR